MMMTAYRGLHPPSNGWGVVNTLLDKIIDPRSSQAVQSEYTQIMACQ